MDQKSQTSYREVKIGKTLYRVTSIFTGEKELGKTLATLAVRGAVNEIKVMPNSNLAFATQTNL